MMRSPQLFRHLVQFPVMLKNSAGFGSLPVVNPLPL
jgi:hypothetical protein